MRKLAPLFFCMQDARQMKIQHTAHKKERQKERKKKLEKQSSRKGKKRIQEGAGDAVRMISGNPR